MYEAGDSDTEMDGFEPLSLLASASFRSDQSRAAVFGTDQSRAAVFETDQSRTAVFGGDFHRLSAFDPSTALSDTLELASETLELAPEAIADPSSDHLAATLLARLQYQSRSLQSSMGSRRTTSLVSFSSVDSQLSQQDHSPRVPNLSNHSIGTGLGSNLTPLPSKPHSLGSRSNSETSVHELQGEGSIAAANSLVQSAHAMLTLQLRIVSMIGRADFETVGYKSCWFAYITALMHTF